MDIRLSNSVMTVKMPEVLEQAFGITRSQARRHLKDGAVRIDGEKWPHLTGCVADIDGKVIQIGKRQFRRIECFIASPVE